MFMRLIDTHAHIQLSNYDGDRPEVLSRAREAGVERILIVGTDPTTNEQALDLVGSQPGLFATVGWHPHDAKDWTLEAWASLRRQAEDTRVVAIGEVGLDYFKNFSPADQQKKVFREAVRLSLEVGKPLVVHSRDAHGDALEILRDEGGKEIQGVMHCFSADAPTARSAMDTGFYISFSAVITYPKNSALREVAAQIPADRLLAETDCPFLPPQSKRGQRNEPSAVGEVVQWLAEIRKTPKERLAEQIWENAERLFRLP
jgi:TatD DNase family protein